MIDKEFFMKRSVLITGGCGFIGSILTERLLDEGFSVRVIDNLMHGNEEPECFKNDPDFEFIKGDVRRKEDVVDALTGMDNVIHLAAIVGDPACKKDPVLAKETNLDASISLFETAKEMGVKRFIFASTCSNYGKMADSGGYVNEDSLLRPVSLYAELKVGFEEYLLSSPRDDVFTPVALRFATAYGVSPRMRFDLTVNEFTKELALQRELVVFGEQFWRPYCHASDLAQGCIKVLGADRETVDRNVFNVGSTDENYQKQMIVEDIKKHIPNVKIKYVKKDEDPRDYKVDFSKINKTLDFNITKTVVDGIKEIKAELEGGTYGDPDSALYRNS
ncbi:MAG: NAD-dependent epimerase/dehydratase family protein [Candidatus Omnitrophica bacterium]|nr:NAD-dependent epimerase/dehydratase family protein [Candidatus Omnitrophota bacterium]